MKLLLGLPGSLRGPAVAGVGVPSRGSPRVAPAYGANALIHACRCTNEKAAEEIVGALLEADPSLPLEAAEGALALHAAAASGFPRVLVGFFAGVFSLWGWSEVRRSAGWFPAFRRFWLRRDSCRSVDCCCC